MANVIRESLQKMVVAYPGGPKAQALQGVASKHLAVYSATAKNRSGGSADVAIFRSVNENNRKAYSMDNSVLSDISSTLNAGSNIAILKIVGDALYIGGKEPFGLVGLTVSTAQVGGTIVYEYWNGSAWTTLPTILNNALTSTGDRYVIFLPPVDWASGDGAVTGLEAEFYHIRWRVTVATATDPVINAYWQGRMLDFQESVADNGGLSIDAIDSHKPLILEAGEGLLPYFSTTSADNLFAASYNFKE